MSGAISDATSEPLETNACRIGESMDVDLPMDNGDGDAPPSFLLASNYDVQSHIMSFLRSADLSALMRTCRYFFDVALTPLCAHSGLPLKTAMQVISFLHFLRLDCPSTSRAKLIKSLNLSLEEYRAPLTRASYFNVQESDPSSHFSLPEAHPSVQEHLLRTSRNSALEAFLHLLQHCSNLRRLRVDAWPDDVPISLLNRQVSNLLCLEDLRMPMFPRSEWGLDMNLANLPLRRLVLRPGRWFDIPQALSILRSLSSTLVELDIPVCQWVAPGVAFPAVRKLGIEFPASEDVVSDLVRTFPNLTHLVLRGIRNFHLCHASSSRRDEDRLRERSQYQWHSLSDSWPSFVSVGAESPCALYTLGMPFHVPTISVGYSANDPAEDMLPVILADTHPTCLEIRIKQVHFKYTPLPRRFGGLRAGDDTASLERLVLTMEGDGIPDYVKVSSLLVDELQRALAPLSVSHVLLKYSVDHFRASRTYTRKVVRAICSAAPNQAAAMAQAVRSLRWLGVLVRVQGGPTWLYCWEVASRQSSARAQEFGCGRPPAVTLTEMDEQAGWGVLVREGMSEIANTQ